MNWLAIAMGGALGAMGRYAIVAYLLPVTPHRFPWGTLFANVLGSLIIGVCAVVIIEKQLLAPQWRLFLMTGFLGAFTTFSAFSLEAVQLWQLGHGLNALYYILISLTACLAATGLAIFITLRLLS